MKPQIIITTCLDVETVITCAGSEHVGSYDNPVDISTLQDSPTGFDCQKTCIYMLTKQAEGIINGQEYREVSIHATIGDVIELYNITLTNELDYEIDSYNLQEILEQDMPPNSKTINTRNFWMIIIDENRLTYKYKWFLKIKSKRNPDIQSYYFCWEFIIAIA